MGPQAACHDLIAVLHNPYARSTSAEPPATSAIFTSSDNSHPAAPIGQEVDALERKQTARSLWPQHPSSVRHLHYEVSLWPFLLLQRLSTLRR